MRLAVVGQLQKVLDQLVEDWVDRIGVQLAVVGHLQKVLTQQVEDWVVQIVVRLAAVKQLQKVLAQLVEDWVVQTLRLAVARLLRTVQLQLATFDCLLAPQEVFHY